MNAEFRVKGLHVIQNFLLTVFFIIIIIIFYKRR